MGSEAPNPADELIKRRPTSGSEIEEKIHRRLDSVGIAIANLNVRIDDNRVFLAGSTKSASSVVVAINAIRDSLPIHEIINSIVVS